MRWGFPKIRGAILGAPIIRIIYLGVHIGVPFFGKLPDLAKCQMAYALLFTFLGPNHAT